MVGPKLKSRQRKKQQPKKAALNFGCSENGWNQKTFRRRQIFEMKIRVEMLKMNTQFDTNEATQTRGGDDNNDTEYLFLDEHKQPDWTSATNVIGDKQWNPNHAISHEDIHFNFFFIAHTKRIGMQYHIIVASSPFLSNFSGEKKEWCLNKKNGIVWSNRAEPKNAHTHTTMPRMPEYHSALFEIELNNANERDG